MIKELKEISRRRAARRQAAKAAEMTLADAFAEVATVERQVKAAVTAAESSAAAPG